MAVMEESVGVVVIGRNEGERLRACLESLAGRRLVYVDSASTDGSVDLARSLGAEVLNLDMSKPFSAARARNAGQARLREISPGLKWVQFVDGDCVVDPAWMSVGAAFLEGSPGYAAVSGRLRERFPERSVYNGLCDLEWDSPLGDADACGGVAMYRLDAFEAAGRFDETVVAGEEGELCLRLRMAGWKIRKLADPMALHDADMTRITQWWKRMVRLGYGGSDVARRFEKGRGHNSSLLRSARIWGIGWPLFVVAAAAGGFLLGGSLIGFLALGAVLAILPLQMLRVASGARRQWGPGRPALAYGVLTMLAKWAHLAGQARYRRDRRAGRHLSLIEYRRPRG